MKRCSMLNKVLPESPQYRSTHTSESDIISQGELTAATVIMLVESGTVSDNTLPLTKSPTVWTARLPLTQSREPDCPSLSHQQSGESDCPSLSHRQSGESDYRSIRWRSGDSQWRWSERQYARELKYFL